MTLLKKKIVYPVHYRVHHSSITTLSGSYFGPFSLIKEKKFGCFALIKIFAHFFAAMVKFKDYLRRLNKMRIGFLANKGKSNDINF